MRNKTISTVIAILLYSLSTSAQDAVAFYKEGVKLKNESKAAEAIEKFKKAITLRPDYTDAQYEMGWCLNDQSRYSEANEMLIKVAKKWAKVPKVYFELAYSYQKMGKSDSAKKYYAKCVELKPDYSLAYKQLGYIEYDNDNCAESIALFDKYETSVKDTIKDYQYWYRKGFCYNATKAYEKAKGALLKSFALNKGNLNTYLELGFANSKLKLNDEAIEYFKQAMVVDPKSHVPFNGIAEVYRDNKKNYAEAMTWYKKTLAIKPKERKANYGIGYCLNLSGKYAEAISFLKVAIEQEATYTAAYVELGFSYYATGNYSEAEKSLLKALSLNPKNENARYYACTLYIKQKNKVMAQKMVNELKALSSEYSAELQKKVDNM